MRYSWLWVGMVLGTAGGAIIFPSSASSFENAPSGEPAPDDFQQVGEVPSFERLPPAVRWARVQATAHRLERAKVMEACRRLLQEWRHEPRRTEVMFFLGQLCERKSAVDQSPPDPVQALSWYELAATTTNPTDPNWLKYELGAVHRTFWKWEPNAPQLNQLHQRLVVAEAVAVRSPLDLARVLEARFALAQRQRDLGLAETVCRRLHDLRTACQESDHLLQLDQHRLSDICHESATSLTRAWCLAPADNATRQQQIENLAREFALSEQETLDSLQLSARRTSSPNQPTRDEKTLSPIGPIRLWLLQFHVVLIVAFFAYKAFTWPRRNQGV